MGLMMANVNLCSLIIKDDFKNVLVLQNKAKRGQIATWCILSLKKRGKETDEKCVNRIAKDALKTIIFDLEKFKDFEINSEEATTAYIGSLKERIVLDKAYSDSKWIGKNDLESINLDETSKNILKEYFK